MEHARANVTLPADSADQKYVSVSALHVGSLYLPDGEVFEDSIGKDTGSTVPSLAFLIEHEVHGRLMFDLGLRKHGKGYPPAWEETVQEFKVDCTRDVVDVLSEGAISPSSINKIVYSHLHFDHVGDLLPFESAEVVVGADTAQLMEDPYPRNPDSLWPEWPQNQKVRYVGFDTTDPPTRPVSPVGTFERGVDLFGDGSLYLIDAPGHLDGHLVALGRIAPNTFVLLAGDCCHNRQCYNPGERLVSRENHHDIDAARDTVKRLKAMNRADNIVLILAHEAERLHEMPLFPLRLNDRAIEETKRKHQA